MGIGSAIAGASLLSAGSSIFGASEQAGAANKATEAQMQMFQQMLGYMKPYMTGGANSLSMLMDKLPGLTTPFAPTMANLRSTPGYQFTKSQGMNAMNNSNSTMGWGDSGPGAKGIAKYVTGLADQTYNERQQNYWQNNQNIYSMLMGPAQLGESAAGALGSAAIGTGHDIASNMIGAGNAWAGGAMGAANSIGNGVSGMMGYNLYNSMMQPSAAMSAIPSGYASSYGPSANNGMDQWDLGQSPGVW